MFNLEIKYKRVIRYFILFIKLVKVLKMILWENSLSIFKGLLVFFELFCKGDKIKFSFI